MLNDTSYMNTDSLFGKEQTGMRYGKKDIFASCLDI